MINKMSIKGKVKWFNGQKDMVSLNEKIRKRMFLFILLQLKQQACSYKKVTNWHLKLRTAKKALPQLICKKL